MTSRRQQSLGAESGSDSPKIACRQAGRSRAGLGVYVHMDHVDATPSLSLLGWLLETLKPGCWVRLQSRAVLAIPSLGRLHHHSEDCQLPAWPH